MSPRELKVGSERDGGKLIGSEGHPPNHQRDADDDGGKAQPTTQGWKIRGVLSFHLKIADINCVEGKLIRTSGSLLFPPYYENEEPLR